MSNRKNYHYKQTVTEAELDAGFDHAEEADRAFIADQELSGVMQGAVPVQDSGGASLNIELSGPAVIYDQLGQRIFWGPTQIVDCSLDEDGNATAVIGGGNARIITVFAEFDRLLSDARVDGNGATVYFERSESFKINVVAGATVASGGEVAPALRVDQIALCDITLITGQTQILTGGIDVTTRREDSFVITGSPNNERAGTTRGALQAFQDQINTFIGGAAASLAYAGGGNWADGTTNPATNIEAQLDKLISDLATGSGTAKLLAAAGPSWADAVTNPSERLDQRLDSIITDLSTGAGAAKILTASGPAWHDATANPAERLDQRIDSIVSDLVANNGADRIGVQASTNGIITAGGSIHDALNELDVAIDAIPAPGVPGVFTRKFSFHKTLGPGAGSTNDMRVQLASSGDKYHMNIASLPNGQGITGFAFYGEHNGAATADVDLYKQVWGSAGGTLVGSFTTTSGIGNIVGSDSFARVAIDGGANWFIRVTSNGAGICFLHSFDITIVD